VGRCWVWSCGRRRPTRTRLFASTTSFDANDNDSSSRDSRSHPSIIIIRLADQDHPEGHTPLHLSAQSGHVEVSQMLVGAGANVHATDNEGKTPLDLAKPRHGDVVTLLLEAEPLTKNAAQGGVGDSGADSDQ